MSTTNSTSTFVPSVPKNPVKETTSSLEFRVANFGIARGGRTNEGGKKAGGNEGGGGLLSLLRMLAMAGDAFRPFLTEGGTNQLLGKGNL